MNKKLVPVILSVLTLASIFTLLSCTQESVDVMAGSSLIGNIIQDVADGGLETRTIIPPGVCPGHYDMKPSDIEALANSKALFIHDYQQYFQNINGAVEAADNPDLIIKALNVTGNWMVPQVQAEAVAEITEALGEIDQNIFDSPHIFLDRPCMHCMALYGIYSNPQTACQYALK